MKIGFFGGSFNPPHFGHILAATYALSRFSFDQIWWAPVYRHAFAKELCSFKHRCAMLQSCLDDLGPKHYLSKVEKNEEAEGKTILTLRHLKQQYPQNQFSLLVGSDSIENFKKWYQFEELQDEFEIAIIPRKTYLIDEDAFFIPNVSSTAARREIKKMVERNQVREELAGWIHPRVLEYISEHGLYQSAKKNE